MKKFFLIFVMLASLFGIFQLRAEVKSPYTVDFNQSIDVDDHAFQVASNWQHIVDKATYSYYGSPEDVYMTYSYEARSGVDGSGCLFASDQLAIAPYYSYDPNKELCDLLVTPLVSGDVTLMVNPPSDSSSLEVYAINADGTKGEKVKTFDSLTPGQWQEVTLLTAAETNGEFKRYGLRCKKMYVDNFQASSADIVKEKKLAISSVSPNLNSYTYWDQNAEGKVMVKYLVTVTNTGEDDLVTGEDGFSITLWEGKNNTDLVTVAVPQNLSVGETSDEFAVETLADSELWGNTYSSVKINLRENITGNSKISYGSYYRAYEPRFILRKAGSSDTYDYTTPIKYGLINTEQSTKLEIYNDGSAPLTIVSMSLPEGFTGLPETTSNFVIESKEKVPFSVTLPTTQTGSFSGQLKIVYLDKDGEEEPAYTLAVSGTVVSPDAYIADFGVDNGIAPAGSIIGKGLSLQDSYDETIGHYLKASSVGGEFITPKFEINNGDVLSFDTARDYYYSNYGEKYNMNVYVSSNRYDWGSPIKTFTDAEITSTTFQAVEVPFDVTGQYYVKIEFKDGRIDNLCAPKTIFEPYDIYLTDFTAPEEVKSNSEISISASAYAVADLAASDYTMEYRTDDVVLYTFASEDLKANAINELSFDAKFTPSVEETTVYDAYIQVRFIDGSIVKTPSKQLTVTNEPVFVFFDKGSGYNEIYKPGNRETPISFGVTNTSGASQEFEILNWGSAPLKVTSIRVPPGFEVTPDQATVAPGALQPVVVKFTATSPRTYGGNLEITHSNKELFKLPINAVLLDPNKWYAEFTPESGIYDPAWPEGTVHGANITGSYRGTYNDPVWYITSYATTDNMFISPKIKATGNETLTINASLGGYYNTGIINVYTAESRKGLEDDATRTKVATLDSTTDDEKLQLTSVFKACEVSMPEGEYYIGFEIKDDACINYFYGLTPVAVENDINIVNTEVPSTVMQNSRVELKTRLHNYAPQPVAGEDYKVVAYIDGVKAAEAEGVELPCVFSYAATPTEISVPVRFPKVGNSTVRLEVIVGNTTLSSDEVQVEVTPEVVNSEKQIGEIFTKGDTSTPLNILYSYSETVMLYTPDQLGLEDGEAITGITFKGFVSKDNFKTDVKLAYAWVDNSSLSQPSGEYDYSRMTVVLDQKDYEWKNEGSMDDSVDVLSVNFSSPLVYEAGKSLLIYASSKSDAREWAQKYGWQTTNIKSNCYYHATDDVLSTSPWESNKLPVLYLSLSAEAVEVSGKVYDEGEAVEGAVVTFISADGENVQYTSTTDATGAYSVNLIQNTRSYNVTVVANDKEDFLAGQSFASNVDDLDFNLLNVVEIDNLSGNTHTPDAGALVKLNLQLEKGFNSIVLPFDVNAEEMKQLFGDDAVVAEYSHSTLAEGSDELKLMFEQTTSMEAGKPYIIYIAKCPEPVIYRGKEVVEHLNHSVDKNANANFHATYEARTLASDEVLLNNDNFVSGRARQVITASPYSAYVKITNPAVKNVSFTVDGNISTGIEEVITVGFGENDVIYNLQGVGVKNPEKGIYIVNGKKIVVK